MRQPVLSDEHQRSIQIRTTPVLSTDHLNLDSALLIPCASLLTVSRTINFLFKVLFIFPSRYLFAIGLVPIFSLGCSLPPIFELHSQTTRLKGNGAHNRPQFTDASNGTITLSGAPFQGNLLHPAMTRGPNPTKTTTRPAKKGPGDSNAWALPASLAATGGILVSFFSSPY